MNMKRWGIAGSIFGGLVGLLLAMLVLLLFFRPAPPPASIPTTFLPPDVTLFISEQSLSRLATDVTGRPAEVNFEPNGRMFVTTPVEIGIFEPVVQVEVLLQLQGTNVISELRAVKAGFLTIPARWLPESALEATALIGQTIETQTPPDFALVGLTTTTDGVNFQLKWIGG